MAYSELDQAIQALATAQARVNRIQRKRTAEKAAEREANRKSALKRRDYLVATVFHYSQGIKDRLEANGVHSILKTSQAFSGILERVNYTKQRRAIFDFLVMADLLRADGTFKLDPDEIA